MTKSNSLTTRAMLIRLSINLTSFRKYDREVSDEVADIHGAKQDAGRYNKMLLPKAYMKDLQVSARHLREHHSANTLPWTIDGLGLLPATNYLAYMGEHRRLALLFEEAKDAFLRNYGEAQEAAKSALGDLYKETDYLPLFELADRIACNVQVMPLPDAEDFRVRLGDEEAERVRADITASVNAAVAGAVQSLWQRVHDRVSAMADRLEMFRRDPKTEKVEHPFRDSVVLNLRELVDLLGRLNVVDDKALEATRQRLLERVCPVEPDELRTDDRLRAKQAKECRDVLSSMTGYMGAVPAMAAE